jgi:RNA methyltransferase, TrmH family
MDLHLRKIVIELSFNKKEFWASLFSNNGNNSTLQDGVFLLPGCCDPFNEKALRAARGASFQLPIISGNWSQLNAFAAARNMKILAGHPTKSGNNPKASKLLTEVVDRMASEALCLVLGSEGNGLSNEALEKAELISIPMESMYESLNVSVAGGIFLFMLQPQNRRD